MSMHLLYYGYDRSVINVFTSGQIHVANLYGFELITATIIKLRR